MAKFLKILAAPEKEKIGIKIPLQEGENILGRVSPPSHILLEGAKVSKRHCIIVCSGSEINIKDLNSSNGVFVNGKKVAESKLEATDRMVVGDYTLELVVS